MSNVIRVYDDAYTPDYGIAIGELVYAGGDTPNPVTVIKGTARYRIPTWVRSNPQQVSPIADAHAFMAWLTNEKVPSGCYTVLDLETAIDPFWVSAFGSVIRSKYRLAPYGSKDFLFYNPPLDGYFVGDYTQVPHMYDHPNIIATQYFNSPAYDLSLWSAVPVWDIQAPNPVPMPAPVPPLPKEINNMTMGYTNTGELVIAGQASDNGNLLVFTLSGGKWGVVDVTESIHNEVPSDPRSYKIS